MPKMSLTAIDKFDGDIFLNTPVYGYCSLEQKPPDALFNVKLSKTQAKELIRDVKKFSTYCLVYGFYKQIEYKQEMYLIVCSSLEVRFLKQSEHV